MWLLLDVDNPSKPNWEGFHFLVNRRMAAPDKAVVEACTDGWAWEDAGVADYRMEGNEMHFALPRQLLDIGSGKFTLDFKWIDNAQQPGELLDGYINGDTAPGGRFRYRYAVR